MINTHPSTAERRIMAPPRTRSATLAPSSWNAEDRTIDVVWTTGARGARFDWESGETVDEELATNPASVRLDRLNAGAPVLDAHQKGDLSRQIGVVVPGSARMEGGQGIATVRFSDRVEVAGFVSDIASGIIRNLSVGYTVHAFDIERRAGQRPLYRAVDWEPYEISFLPVPFDALAQVRSAPVVAPCILRNHSSTEYRPMPDHQDNIEQSPPAGQPSGNGRRGDQPASIQRIREYVGMAGGGFGLQEAESNGIILDMAERGLSEQEVRTTMTQILAERQRAQTGTITTGGPAIVERWGNGNATMDNPNFQSRAIEDAIYARMSGRQPTEQARGFMHMSLVQMAGKVAERAGVRNVESMAPGEVLNVSAWTRTHGTDASYLATRAHPGSYHSTSSFPDILTGAGERFLLDMFAAAESPLKKIGRRRSARDFRPISGLQLSGFGTLPEVLEAGEIKSGTFKSRKESYAVKTFAKMFGLTRQAIINDDLGAFSDPIRIMSKAAAETEASLLADLLNSNPSMSDANALFHAAHGNLAPAGAAPAVASISAGRLAMRSQKDLDGVTPIAAAPKYILSSPASETLIEQLLTVINPNQVDEANPFVGKLQPLVDPRLDDLPWYLFADPLLAPILEYAYLDGHEGPRVEMQDGWTTLGTSFRVYMDFGAGLIDWRGGYKNPGAAV
ncbi:prohead protease/major capsid protein fusion protein [Sphingomonas sp. VDB2]|uniref:prohead protease/major capsid protein fusion protein n=1 Tax=Sphingomonas sp. VDB2 TaxID=3228751 RepID=UPI003A80A163